MYVYVSATASMYGCVSVLASAIACAFVIVCVFISKLHLTLHCFCSNLHAVLLLLAAIIVHAVVVTKFVAEILPPAFVLFLSH